MKKSLLRGSTLVMAIACGTLLAACDVFTPEHQHTYSGNYQTSATEHWKICECGDKGNVAEHTFSGVVTTQPTHTAEGVITYTCDVCGYTKTEVAPKIAEHTFTGDFVSAGAEGHYQVCECNEHSTVYAHNMDMGKVTKPATTLEKGVFTYTCSDCGYTETKEIEMINGGTQANPLTADEAVALFETLDAATLAANTFYVEGIITSVSLSTKEATSGQYCIYLETSGDKALELYYPKNSSGIDPTKVLVGNKAYVQGPVTIYRDTTFEWVDATGLFYRVEVMNHSIVKADNRKLIVTGLPTAPVANGTEVTFTAAAVTGYKVDAVYCNGKNVKTNEDGSFTVQVLGETVIDAAISQIGGEPTGGEGITETATLNVVGNFSTYGATWSSSYEQKEISFADLGYSGSGSLVLGNADKQSGTITDRPTFASKSSFNAEQNSITVHSADKDITSAKFELKEWSTSKKFKSIYASTSTDGTTWTEVSGVGFKDVSGGQTVGSIGGLIQVTNLPAGTRYVRVHIIATTTSNTQVGIGNIELGLFTEGAHTCKGTEVKAVEATCTEAGHVAYYKCSCGKIYADEACTTPITIETVTVPATGHALQHVAEHKATCTEGGNNEYWFCPTCGVYFKDAKATEAFAKGAHLVAALGHKAIETKAVKETCTEAGNTAYWYCPVCGVYFSDAACTTAIAEGSWVVPATGHNPAHTAAVEATCTKDGNIEYWYCDNCKAYFADEACTQAIVGDVVVKAIGHKLNKVEAVEATCTTKGNIEHYECEHCHALFEDEEGKTPVTQVEIAALGHTMEYHAKEVASCADGNEEYFYCTTCEKYFYDIEGKHEYAENAWFVPATGVHQMAYVAKTAPTHTATGEMAHFHCDICGKNYEDVKGEVEIEDVTIAKLEQFIQTTYYFTQIDGDAGKAAPQWTTRGTIIFNDEGKGKGTSYPLASYDSVISWADEKHTTLKLAYGTSTVYTCAYDAERNIFVCNDGSSTFVFATEDYVANMTHAGSHWGVGRKYKVVEITLGEEKVNFFFDLVAKTNYIGVAITDAAGTTLTAGEAAASDTVIITYKGEVVGKFGFDATEDVETLVPADKVIGKYTCDENTLVLSGTGIATLNGVKGTYEVESDGTIEVIAGEYIIVTLGEEGAYTFVKPTVDVVFDHKGHGSNETIALNTKVVATLPVLENTATEKFIGWSLTDGGAIVEEYIPTEATTLYAIYATIVHITYIDTDNMINTQIVLGEGEVIGKYLPADRAIGFARLTKFYYVDADGSHMEIDPTTKVSSDDEGLVIYAEWVELPHYVGTFVGAELYGKDYMLGYNKETLTGEKIVIADDGKITFVTSSGAKYEQGTVTGPTTDGKAIKFGKSGDSYRIAWTQASEDVMVVAYSNTLASSGTTNYDYSNSSDFNVLFREGKFTLVDSMGIFLKPTSTSRETSSYAKLIQTKDAYDNTIWFYLFGGQIYAYVSVTTTAGVALENIAAVKASADLKICDEFGTILSQFAALTSANKPSTVYDAYKYGFEDAFKGTYTLATAIGTATTLELNGFSTAKVGEMVGTYVISGVECSVKFEEANTYYVFTLDTAEKTATWAQPKSSVTFVGTFDIAPAPITPVMNTKIQLPSPTNGKLPFAGWYVDEQCKTKVTLDENGLFEVTNDSYTLYAKFLQIFDVTFVTAAGEQKVEYVEGQTLDTHTFTATVGKLFRGFFAEEGFVTPIAEDAIMTEAKTIYVKEVNPVKLTVVWGEPYSDTIITFGEGDMVTTEDFDNLAFGIQDGWYQDDKFTTPYVPGVINAATKIFVKLNKDFVVVTNDAKYPWRAGYVGDVFHQFVSTNNGVSNSTSEITIKLVADGQVAFAYAGSAEGNYDYITVIVNGVTRSKVSSTSTEGYSNVKFTDVKQILAKDNTIVFKFTKDGSGNKAYDCALVKNLTFTAPDGLSGTYGGEFGEIVLDGFGGGKIGAKTATYTFEGNDVEVSDGTNLYNVTVDTAEFTYTVNNASNTVTFDLDGVTANKTAVELATTYFANVGLVLPTISSETHVFKGWKNAKGDIITTLLLDNADEGVTLTASWVPYVTVSFTTGTAETVSDKKVEQGTKIGTLPTLTTIPAGKYLAGWIDADGNTIDANFVVNAAISLAANWQDQPAYVGTWKGFEVYNGKILTVAKTVTIGLDGAMNGLNSSWKIDTVNFNKDTVENTYKYNANSSKFFYNKSDNFETIVINYSFSSSDILSGSDIYVFVKTTETVSYDQQAHAFWGTGTYGTNWAFQYNVGSKVCKFYLDTAANKVYSDVTIVNGVEDRKAYQITDGNPFTIKDGDTVLVEGAYDATTKTIIKIGAEKGTYTLSSGVDTYTLILDGVKTATYETYTGTYVINETNSHLEINIPEHIYLEATYDVASKTATLVEDKYAGTYTGDNGNLVIYGNGVASYMSGDYYYYFEGGLLVLTDGAKSLKLGLDTTAKTYALNSIFSGLTFTNPNSSIAKIIFNEGPEITGKVSINNTWVSEFSGTYDSATHKLVITITKAPFTSWNSSHLNKVITFTVATGLLTPVAAETADIGWDSSSSWSADYPTKTTTFANATFVI